MQHTAQYPSLHDPIWRGRWVEKIYWFVRPFSDHTLRYFCIWNWWRRKGSRSRLVFVSLYALSGISGPVVSCCLWIKRILKASQPLFLFVAVCKPVTLRLNSRSLMSFSKQTVDLSCIVFKSNLFIPFETFVLLNWFGKDKWLWKGFKIWAA